MIVKPSYILITPVCGQFDEWSSRQKVSVKKYSVKKQLQSTKQVIEHIQKTTLDDRVDNLMGNAKRRKKEKADERKEKSGNKPMGPPKPVLQHVRFV